MSLPVKVLIANAHDDYTLLLRELLSFSPNINVIGIAKDGYKAHLLALNLKPDVLLLDILLPGIDGLEVLRRLNIKENEGQPKVFILTGFYLKEIAEKAMSLGALHYLLKPYKTSSLIDLICSTNVQHR